MSIQLVLNKSAQHGVPVKVFTKDIEQEAIQQLRNLAQLEFVHHHIAVMPDVHVGKGATVGSVIPTKDAIIPAAVGVDIGCGMNAVRLSLKAHQLPDNLAKIRTAIEAKVPVGFNQHQAITVKMTTLDPLAKRLKRITDKHKGLLKMLRNFERTWAKQLGTLGGGNHFIELCIDENEDVWVMLHSGSRGIGNCIGEYFITLAKKEQQSRFGHVPDRDLAYFAQGSHSFDDYLEAVQWGQDYALENRREMMRLIINVLQRELPHFTLTREAINCHHNYVSQEHHYGEDVYVVHDDGTAEMLKAEDVYFRVKRNIYSNNATSPSHYVVVDPETRRVKQGFTTQGHVTIDKGGDLYIRMKQGMGIVRHRE